MMMKITFILFLLLLITSCESDIKPPSDSENGRIVESQTPKFEHSFWSVSTEPVLLLGNNEGEDHYRFYRSFDALKLENGNLLITNSGTHEIRFYDEDGNFLKTVGQEGRGPGDFGSFSNMRLYRLSNNTIGVGDSSNDRIQIYDTDGNHLKVYNQLKIKGFGNPRVVDVLSDGSWLVWSSVGSAALLGNPGEFIQKEYAFHRLFPDWTYDKMLFQIPARTRYIHKYRGVTHYPFIPLTPDPLYVADAQNGVLFSTTSDPILTRVDTTGKVTEIFKWNLPRKKVSDIWQRYKEEDYLSGLSGDRLAQYQHFLDQDIHLPKLLPALSEIKVDQTGNIWIQRFSLSWEDQKIWDVLGSDGIWLGSVELPPDFTVTEIGADYLLGYTYKSGYQQIAMYKLRKDS